MKIVVAMSGGVDSSVAALLLKQQGHELIGISMKLSDAPTSSGTKSSGCCSVEDLTDARRVCDSLDIPYYAINFKDHFKEKVIDTFVDEYLGGRTPNPCVLCNSELKFDLFLEKAAQLGADGVATGHYAQISFDEKDGLYHLYRGRDPKKDQSYFLYGLKQKDLPKILFPVGHLTKVEVRAIAAEANLKTKDKAESQEICFVPNDDAASFIESYSGVQGKKGDFIDEEGRVLGQHLGVHHYTIGQRRGTQVAGGKRLYINKIDVKTNQITLAEEKALYHHSLLASKLSWIAKAPSEEEWIEAKIRYRVQASPCQIRILENGHVQVNFQEAQRAIAPGQALVFYRAEEVWEELGLTAHSNQILSETQKTVAIHTLGCRANQYDSAALEGILKEGGWHLVPFHSPAHAYVLNTCTVTQKADQEASYLIRKAHRQNPDASIIVTGCYAQTDPEKVAQIPGVSFVLGNGKKESVLEFLNKEKPLSPQIYHSDLFKEKEIFTSDIAHFSKNSRAYLKIQDGCNQMCSYCVIPYARGNNRSLKCEEVMRLIKSLSDQAFNEVVLTGIHIGTYGKDLNQNFRLEDLMLQIIKEKPIHRVRLSSIDPEEVSAEMIGLLQDPIFCPHLHIPLQSGDDEILSQMRRRYTAGEFLDLSFKLKEKIPSICLGTDIMPGFPGETEEAFENSYRLLEKSPIDYLHVFPYSPKKKTRAALFSNQIPHSVKKQRVEKLMKLSEEKKNQFYEKQLGYSREIILEEKHSFQGEEYRRGMSENFVPISVPFSSSSSLQKGSLIHVQVQAISEGHVFGEIIR